MFCFTKTLGFSLSTPVLRQLLNVWGNRWRNSSRMNHNRAQATTWPVATKACSHHNFTPLQSLSWIPIPNPQSQSLSKRYFRESGSRWHRWFSMLVHGTSCIAHTNSVGTHGAKTWSHKCSLCINDPSAGSPTETLLRLLLPLSDLVYETSP